MVKATIYYLSGNCKIRKYKIDFENEDRAIAFGYEEMLRLGIRVEDKAKNRVIMIPPHRIDRYVIDL